MSCCGAKCCKDFDIKPEHLLFPERMSAIGQEFLMAHGVTHLSLAELRTGAILMPDGQVKIQHRCQHLDETDRCRIYTMRPQICRDFDCSTRTDCCEAKANG